MYPWAQGHICSSLSSIANLPLRKVQWTRSDNFHWDDHRKAIFAPSSGIEDVIPHTEALTKVTQAHDDSHQSLTLITEMSSMRKVVLQIGWYSIAITTASQAGTHNHKSRRL